MTDLEVRLLEAQRKFVPLLQHNKKIISNGEENNTPYWIKYFTEESPTANASLSEFIRYTAGKDIKAENLVDKLNKEVRRVYRDGISSYCGQGGIFLAIYYKAVVNGDDVTFEPNYKECRILPYENMRISKDLEDGHSFYYESNWIDAQSNLNFGAIDKNKYYPFNPDSKAIISQMKVDFEESQKSLRKQDRTEFTVAKGLEVYRGQVAFFNPSNMDYPLSPFYSAIGAMRTEVNADDYEGRTISGGFMDKSIFMLSTQDKSLGKKIRNAVNGLVTNPNAPAIVIETTDLDIDLKDYIHQYKIESSYNDKLLVNAVERAKENIILSANNIPSVLINPAEAMFGNSGESFNTAEEIYSRKCEPLRDDIIEFLNEALQIEIQVSPLV